MKDSFSCQSDKKIIIKVRGPQVEMSIINRLGKPKFWVSDNDFFEVMKKIYGTASRRAREIYNGSD